MEGREVVGRGGYEIQKKIYLLKNYKIILN